MTHLTKYILITVISASILAWAGISFVQAADAPSPRKYLVKVQLNDTELQTELDKESMLGWKLIQACHSTNGGNGVDLIFSR
jgi:hypothetical protein